MNEEDIKNLYVSKLIIRAKRMKLIDNLKDEKYRSKSSQQMLTYAIKLLNELLEN